MKIFNPLLFLSALLCCALAHGNPTLTRVAPGYIPGGTLDVRLDFNNPEGIAFNALYIGETLPAGWTFHSVVSDTSGVGVGNRIDIESGASKFECLWLEMPATNSFRLTYRVNVPASAANAQTFAGVMDWAWFENTPKTVVVGGNTRIFSVTQVAAPVISPEGGTFEESQWIELDCAEEGGADIYYTLDGSTPTTSGTRYAGPFEITQACTVTARAFKSGKSPSEVVAATFFQAMVRNAAPIVGVRVDRKLADIGNAMGGAPSLVKISRDSLPAGLKIALVKDGSNWSVMLTGAPTSTTRTALNVVYEVRVRVTQGGKTSTVTLSTIEIRFEPVDPLPAPVVGTFNGWLEDVPGLGIGVITMTLSSKGAVSGKITLQGGSHTFKATAFDTFASGILHASADVKAGSKTWDRIELLIDAATGAIEGALVVNSTADVRLFRNNWNNTAFFKSQFDGYYTAQIHSGMLCPDDTAPEGSGYMTLTLSGKGAAKWSGKLADGQSFSGSGTLLHDTVANAFYLPVVVSYASKKGSFAAILEIEPGAVNTPLANTLVSSGGYWRNTDFRSVYTEGLDLSPGASPPHFIGYGFYNTVRVAGGFYNKTANFVEHYRNRTLTLGNTPADRQLAYTYTAAGNIRTTEYADPIGPEAPTALVVSAAGLGYNVRDDLKKQPDGSYNYAAASNPFGLTFRFTKATGLFSGKFNIYYDYRAREGAALTHVKRSVNYNGVLTPLRSTADAALPEGAGYYLLNLGEKCHYIDEWGRPKTYNFTKWSYGFWINAD